MNPHDLTNLANDVGATCHTHSMGRATSIMFSIHQLEQFAERLVAEEREKRIATQTENEALKMKLARSGVEQNRAVHAAILKEREACSTLILETKEWKGLGGFSTLCPATKELIAETIRERSNNP